MGWRIATAALAVALLGTNLLWLYNALDEGIGRTYLLDSLEGECRALDEALAILPAVAGDTPRSEVLAAAVNVSGDREGFETEGAHWIGHLGFRFADGRLVEVERGWSPKGCE